MPTSALPQRIAFIGAGNMAKAIMGGLLDTGVTPEQITAADPFPEALAAVNAMGIGDTSPDAQAVVSDADFVILAVKPQVMADVCHDLNKALNHKPVVMSIAAGITVNALKERLDVPGLPIIRCMPNTPALVRCGAAALFAPDGVSDIQRQQAEAIMAAVGTTLWVEKESALDAVTALSGSGPAYFFAFIEAMISAGEQLGLPWDDAYQLTLQTALGSARLAVEQEQPVATLRRNVTSPGGTTERALNAFARGGLDNLVEQAMAAAFTRSQELSGDQDSQ